jgi:hypothetical protein
MTGNPLDLWTMTARFPGTCVLCGRAIRTGDQIGHRKHGWAHEDCLRAELPTEKAPVLSRQELEDMLSFEMEI